MSMILNTLIPLCLSILPLSIGIGALFFPKTSSVIYGAPSADRGFVWAAGVRDFFIAFVIFELWREQETRSLYLSILALAFVSAGDGAVTWISGNRKRTPLHIASAAAVGIYSIYMLNFR